MGKQFRLINILIKELLIETNIYALVNVVLTNIYKLIILRSHGKKSNVDQSQESIEKCCTPTTSSASTFVPHLSAEQSLGCYWCQKPMKQMQQGKQMLDS